MNNISILDCTLRDGGYVNQWNFGAAVIRKIIGRLTEANIDIIECGFISDCVYDSNFAIFNTTSAVSDVYGIEGKKPLYVGMIALGEKEIHYSKVAPCGSNTLGGIRITFHRNPTEVARAIEFATDLMAKGYQVFMQPVGTMFYTDIELLGLVEKINNLKPYAFYIVDTLGSMGSDDLLRLFYIIDHNLDSNIKIGFHSHNNLQLSFSNAKALLDLRSNRNIIIDSSVFGMGRGAGNLCTELIAGHINTAIQYRYDCIKLFSIIDTCLIGIKEKQDWGYSAAYYIAASKNCHPNYASYLMGKRTLCSADIDKILTMIPNDISYLYNQDLIAELYLRYQAHVVDDSAAITDLTAKFSGQSVVLIAPGPSVMRETETIKNKIEQTKAIAVSINFSGIFESDYVFVSNKKRSQSINMEKENIIVTSNVEQITGNHHIINYISLLNKSGNAYENAGLMAINLLLQLGVTHIYLAGFDGFTSDKNHYDQMENTSKSVATAKKLNQDIQEILAFYSSKIKLEFVTDSLYRVGA